MRLRPALEGYEVCFATTCEGYEEQVRGSHFFTVPDASQWTKLRLIWSAARVAWLVLRLRPAVILSTGAAPGFFALLFGRLVGARGVWIDSVANAETLSMSGKLAGRVAKLWLTQWPEVAREGGPEYAGSVY